MFTNSSNAGFGLTPFGTVDTAQRHPIGTIVRAVDPTQGEGEFIYLPGVAATAVGDLVAYDLLPSAPAVVRTTAAGQPNSGRPVAVALGAYVAGTWGWYQIGGVAVVNATAASAAGTAFLTATAGSVNSAQGNGVQVLGARLSSAVGTPAAGQAYITLSRPTIQGQVV